MTPEWKSPMLNVMQPDVFPELLEPISIHALRALISPCAVVISPGKEVKRGWFYRL